MTKILPVIMCGGSGTRIWPESRESLPKQFIPLIGDRSTFQSIITVVGATEVFERPLVITNYDYRFRVAEQLKEVDAEATILLELERRDSAAAVGAVAAWAASRDPKTIVAVLAADHVFQNENRFVELCVEAAGAAEAGEIVTFGVKPDHPATGYGYIHPGEALAVDPKVRRVERFVEKPDEARAKAFIEAGYLWNSGNFVFRADIMLEELNRFEPKIAEATAEAVALAKEDLGFIVLDRDAFARAPRTSIDYAVMERTRRAAVLEADVGWSDVGQWSTVWRLSPQDANGNSLRGRAVAIEFLERARPLGRALGRGDRPRQRGRGGDRRRDPGRRQGADGQGQAIGRTTQGRESAGGDAAPTDVPSLGLLSEHRPGTALPGQTDRGAAGRPAVAAEALSSRRALDRSARGRRGDVERGRASSCTKTSRSIYRSVPITGWPIPARSTSN